MYSFTLIVHHVLFNVQVYSNLNKGKPRLPCAGHVPVLPGHDLPACAAVPGRPPHLPHRHLRCGGVQPLGVQGRGVASRPLLPR